MSEPPGPSAQHDNDDSSSFLKLVDEIWPQLTDGQAQEDSAHDDPPSTTPDDPFPAPDPTAITIGRFVIERELGRGGGGIVLLAYDPALHRTVAMKVPGLEGIVSTRSRRRFVGEARAVAALRHPNIVTIYEAGEAGVVPYIIMDYCEAGSLADLLAARPAGRAVPMRWAARLMARIADGVQHAHDRGILHRDLKPSNILFSATARDGSPATASSDAGAGDDPDLNPIVTDFGLAKRLDATRDGIEDSVAGLPLGTLHYMSPEAARGDSGAIGFATDVYGLGVILFELLTGRRPFEAPSRDELLGQVLNAEPPAPRTLRPDLATGLERIVLKCLQKVPSDRYQTTAELASALRAFLENPGRTDLVERKPRNRTRPAVFWLLALGLGLACALTIGGLGLRWKRMHGQAQAQLLMQRLQTADLAALPALVPKYDLGEATVVDALTRMYQRGSPDQKLAAAIVLARVSAGPRDYCYQRLLEASPDAIVPLARLLQPRMPGLTNRLKSDVTAPAASGEALEARDRRRARAACLLIALGSGAGGWPLLRFAPDPQPRSFLIHELGPAGIAPEVIVERMSEERDPSIRRALIQSLGAVPDARWPAPLRARFRSDLIALYENDPDPGVHGSARWLLLRWSQQGAIAECDGRLARSAPRHGFHWRISPLGLTMVTIADPKSRQAIEVADTELTVAHFRTFRGDHSGKEGVSPGPAYPVTDLNYIAAAQFCNWLSIQEGLPRKDLVYRPGTEPAIEAVDDQEFPHGYRLLTTAEYARCCRAGTTTRRYYGNADSLLPEYAWYGQSYELRMHPVGRLKPNDLGLFDMLGNADELCQGLRDPANPSKQAAVCGGSVVYGAASIRCDQKRGPISVTQHDLISTAFGFRVARTIDQTR